MFNRTIPTMLLTAGFCVGPAVTLLAQGQPKQVNLESIFLEVKPLETRDIGFIYGFEKVQENDRPLIINPKEFGDHFELDPDHLELGFAVPVDPLTVFPQAQRKIVRQPDGTFSIPTELLNGLSGAKSGSESGEAPKIVVMEADPSNKDIVSGSDGSDRIPTMNESDPAAAKPSNWGNFPFVPEPNDPIVIDVPLPGNQQSRVGTTAHFENPFAPPGLIGPPQFEPPEAKPFHKVEFAILSDIEAFFFQQAAQGNEGNVMEVPNTTLFNGQSVPVDPAIGEDEFKVEVDKSVVYYAAVDVKQGKGTGVFSGSPAKLAESVPTNLSTNLPGSPSIGSDINSERIKLSPTEMLDLLLQATKEESDPQAILDRFYELRENLQHVKRLEMIAESLPSDTETSTETAPVEFGYPKDFRIGDNTGNRRNRVEFGAAPPKATADMGWFEFLIHINVVPGISMLANQPLPALATVKEGPQTSTNPPKYYEWDPTIENFVPLKYQWDPATEQFVPTAMSWPVVPTLEEVAHVEYLRRTRERLHEGEPIDIHQFRAALELASLREDGPELEALKKRLLEVLKEELERIHRGLTGTWGSHKQYAGPYRNLNSATEDADAAFAQIKARMSALLGDRPVTEDQANLPSTFSFQLPAVIPHSVDPLADVSSRFGLVNPAVAAGVGVGGLGAGFGAGGAGFGAGGAGVGVGGAGAGAGVGGVGP